MDFNSIKNLISKIREKGDIFKRGGIPSIVILAVIVGLVGGLGAVAFYYLIDAFKILFWGEAAGPGFLDTIRDLPTYYRIAIPALGGLIIGPVVTFIVPEAKGHGVPEVMESVALKSGKIRPLVAPLKALVSAICIGSGGAAGREGPIVQIGSSFGSSVGQFLKLSPKKTETLLGAGAAAGIAGTFNAPLAGVLFAIEVILKDVKLDSFGPLVVSSVVGTGIANIILGVDRVIFNLPAHEIVSLWEIVPYIGLGFAAAGVALLFTNSLYFMEDIFEESKFPKFLKPALGGLFLGLLALVLPEIHATGYPVMEDALTSELPLLLILVLVFGKILATDLTLGSGGSGGIFAPSLFIGAMLGGAYGGALNSVFPEAIAGASSYGIIGMGAVFAGATHAPITSIVIIFEMTRDPFIFLPLMFACIISSVVTSYFQENNIYTTKLLNRGVDIDALRETSVLRNTQVRDVMNTEVITISEDDTLEEAQNIFKETFRSRLPVIKEDTNEFVGMLEHEQILGYMGESDEYTRVKDFTFPSPVAVGEHDDLLKALKLSDEVNMEVLPVVSEDKKDKFKGTISRGDIIQAYHQEVSGGDLRDEPTLTKYAEVDIGEVIKFSLRPMEKQADEKDIEIECDIKEDLPPVRANSSKISWVLTNLIGNALRHTDSGDSIKVSASQEGDKIHVSIEDNGPGIPEKYQQKIFEKYVQLDKNGEGRGIGLAVAKDIIERHGGDIWVESEVGEGSKFTFTLKTFPEVE